MKHIAIVLLLIAICCSACTSQFAQESSTSSAVETAPPLSSQSEIEKPSSLSEQETSAEFDTSAEEAPQSATPDYQGFTQEQWQKLQDQKELYGDLTTFEKGTAAFNGDIDCYKFIHLEWEHLIATNFIYHVGANEFEAWLKELRNIDNLEHCDIYGFSRQFSITLDELVLLIETNGLTHIYDVETVKRRYEYFAENPYTEAEILPTAPVYRHGLTKKQWQRLQDQKEMYEGLITKEEREEAVSSGKIECPNFEHLYWEHWVGMPFGTYFSDFVEVEEFNTWKSEREQAGRCVDVYSFAKYFSLELDELMSARKENETGYDWETFERRYAYFNGGSQE